MTSEEHGQKDFPSPKAGALIVTLRPSMEKRFDTVEFQRKVRKKFSEQYSSDREAFVRELKDKYGHLPKGKTKAQTE